MYFSSLAFSVIYLDALMLIIVYDRLGRQLFYWRDPLGLPTIDRIVPFPAFLFYERADRLDVRFFGVGNFISPAYK